MPQITGHRDGGNEKQDISGAGKNHCGRKNRGGAGRNGLYKRLFPVHFFTKIQICSGNQDTVVVRGAQDQIAEEQIPQKRRGAPRKIGENHIDEYGHLDRYHQ